MVDDVAQRLPVAGLQALPDGGYGTVKPSTGAYAPSPAAGDDPDAPPPLPTDGELEPAPAFGEDNGNLD